MTLLQALLGFTAPGDLDAKFSHVSWHSLCLPPALSGCYVYLTLAMSAVEL